MSELLGILKFIDSHPLARRNRLAAFGRFVGWQLKSRLGAAEHEVPFVDDTRLRVRRGMRGATGNIYAGLMEFPDMAFTLHFLKDSDLFADVGANVGVYSVLAAGVRGARTVAFEPTPETLADLRANLALNFIDDWVTVLECALGAEAGTQSFVTDMDTINHVATAADTAAGHSTREVQVRTLDEVFADRAPTLMKIDVEGFETEVLRGATKTLADPALQAIIIELNGSGERYGYDERAIHDLLTGQGFQCHTYDAFTRALSPAADFGDHNTIYVRDSEHVAERLTTAPPFRVLAEYI